MAAVERVLVAQGWHLPRWRTTNTEYGRFYKPRIPPSASTLRHPPSHHIDYINYAKSHPLRNHPAPSPPSPPTAAAVTEPPSSSYPSSAPTLQEDSLFVRTNYGAELNSHIQDLTLQDERPGMIQRQVPDVDEWPPWRPKPLKPMILFEKKAKEVEKERALDRLSISVKRKISSDRPQEPLSPNKKRQQIKHTTYSRSENSTDSIHPATQRYSYYKYYGFGGQGAKTSWGHNYPLAQKPPFSRRTKDLD